LTHGAKFDRRKREPIRGSIESKLQRQRTAQEIAKSVFFFVCTFVKHISPKQLLLHIHVNVNAVIDWLSGYITCFQQTDIT
jgi:hypothetical protein